VEHPVDPGQQLVEVDLVEVAAHEVEPLRGEPGEVQLLDPEVVVVGQAVDADDVMALVQQCAGEVAPDEAGDAGDQCSHAANLSWAPAPGSKEPRD
jgi:hypothetical protein